MAEYIKRSYIREMAMFEMAYTMETETDAAVVLRMIDDAPAADVAPVVRCKDCKHYRNYPNGLCYLHTEPKTNARGYSGEAVCVEPDDFCSYGERKDVK